VIGEPDLNLPVEVPQKSRRLKYSSREGLLFPR
jgi:hypothetical protein